MVKLDMKPLSFDDVIPTGSIHDSNQDDHSEDRTGSSLGAYFNIMCAVAGTGTLGLPGALKDGGWVALTLIFLSCMFSIYTSKLLIECLYYNPNKRLKEFPDIGEAAFGTYGRIFVKVFHYSIQLFSGCLYIMLTGIFSRYVAEKAHGNPVMDLRLWILVAGIIATIPVALLKTVKEVVVLSAFGAIATLVMVLCVAVQSINTMSQPDFVSPDHYNINWAGLPFAMGTVAFAYSGNVVYPHIEGGMRHPKSWNKVLVSALLSVTAMYFLIAIAGYLAFGLNTKSPILLSLPLNTATEIAIIVISLHVLLATPIYLCAFCLEQENWLKIDRRHMSRSREFFCRVAFRFAVGAGVTLIAMYIPFFSDVMALIGSVSNCILIFLVPLACHYKLFGFRNRHPLEYVLGVLSILTGVTGLILGSHSAVNNLILDFKGERKSDFFS